MKNNSQEEIFDVVIIILILVDSQSVNIGRKKNCIVQELLVGTELYQLDPKQPKSVSRDNHAKDLVSK